MLTQYRSLLLREWLLVKKGYKKFIAILFVLPTVLALLFTYAINVDVHHLPTAVFNQSPREESRDLLAAFQNTGYFDIRYAARSYQEVSDLIESGRAKVGIIIPPDFTDNIKHGRATNIQVIVDDSDFRNVTVAKNIAPLIGQIRLQETLLKKMQSTGGKQSQLPFEVRLRNWYNMEGDSAFSILPGVTCGVLILTIMISFSINIVTDRQRGIFERLRAAKISPLLYFSAKAMPYILGAFLQFTLLLLIQVYGFNLPFRGSVILLYLFAGFYILACMAIAFLIGKASAKHLMAVPFIFLTFILSILLGGFVGPRSGLAELLFWAGYAVPMTYFLEIMRGIMLKGVGIVQLWIPILGLLVYCAAAMLIIGKNKNSAW